MADADTAEEEPSLIGMLPPEMLAMVLSWLPDNTVTLAARVSKTWRTALGPRILRLGHHFKQISIDYVSTNPRLLSWAVRNGLLEALHSSGSTIRGVALVAAEFNMCGILKNTLEILTQKNVGSHLSHRIIATCNYRAVATLMEFGAHWTSSAYEIPAKMGRIDILDLLYANRNSVSPFHWRPRRSPDPFIAAEAAARGDAAVVRWIHTKKKEGVPCWTYSAAAKNGHVNVLDVLYNLGVDPKIYASIVNQITTSAHPAVVEWGARKGICSAPVSSIPANLVED